MSALETFDAVVEELMIKQRIRGTHLYERMRNIMTNACKDLPPVEVLYCSIGSWYCYSKEFESFLETVTIPDSLAILCAMEFGPEPDDFNENIFRCSHKNRVRHVQWLAPFGKDVIERWPGIVPLLQAYKNNDLGNNIERIIQIYCDKDRLNEILEISEAIGAQTGTIDGRTNHNFHWLGGDHDFSVYAPSALGEMRKKCDAERSRLSIIIEECRDRVRMHLSEAQISAIDKSFDEDHVKDYEESEKWERLSFIERLEMYGENHCSVWEKQNIFNPRAMRFLCLHPEHTKQLASQGNRVDCTKLVGLCAAGGDCCYLKLAEVPRTVEWKVSNSDGLETVHLA